jgi:hypothetical protein
MAPALPPVAVVDVPIGEPHGAAAVVDALEHSPSVLLRLSTIRWDVEKEMRIAMVIRVALPGR